MANVDDLFGNVEMGTVITCPVCRDIYNLTDRTPINIPCGHTICTQCLNALIARGGPPVLMCPVCRKRHYLHQTPGGNLSRFPKNFQLLEVVEKVIQLKETNNHSLDRFTSCRDCKNETSESSCTQCSCVKDLPNGEVDFMNRPKNTLICMGCINTLHKDHDFKPICAVKAEFENMEAMREVKCTIDRIREKSETAKQAFDNSKEELTALLLTIDKSFNRLNGRPKDASLREIIAKYHEKLRNVERNVVAVGNSCHQFATTTGAHSDILKEYGITNRPRNVRTVALEPRPRLNAPENEIRFDNLGDGFHVVLRVADGADHDAHIREAVGQLAALGERDPDVIDQGGFALRRELHNAEEHEHLGEMLRGIVRMVGQIARGGEGDEAREQNRVQEAHVRRRRLLLVNRENIGENNQAEVVVIEPDVEVAANNQERLPIQLAGDGDRVEDGGNPRRRRGQRRQIAQNQAEAVVVEPQEPDVAVEVQAADPAPMRRRGRPGANQQRHDPIQREAQNTRGNARIRRPARRFGDAQLE